MAKYHYYAEITYTIDKNHPDIGCVADWTKDKIFEYHINQWVYIAVLHYGY